MYVKRLERDFCARCYMPRLTGSTSHQDDRPLFPNCLFSRELDEHGERVVIFFSSHCLHHRCGRNKPSGPFEKAFNKPLIDCNTLPERLVQVVAQQPTDVPRIIFVSKEKKQSKAAPPDSSTELHQSLSSGPLKRLHLHAGMLLRVLLRVPCRMHDLNSNLDTGDFTDRIQHGPDPVGPQKEPLPVTHHRAAEGIGKVQLETAPDVSH